MKHVAVAVTAVFLGGLGPGSPVNGAQTQDMAININDANRVQESRVGPNLWQIGATIFNRTSSPNSVSVGFAHGSIGWYKPVPQIAEVHPIAIREA